MTRTATVSIDIPKERYWPKGWERPTALPQFRSRDTGAMEVLQNGVWQDVPSQAALHIRVLTCEVGHERRKLKTALEQIRESLPIDFVLCEDADGNFFVDDAPAKGDF